MKKPVTPNTAIRAALRRLWMKSRERSQALKNASYTCAECGAKQSKAKGREVKVNVHHKEGVDWEGLFDDIRRRLIHTPDKYEVLCVGCHEKEGEKCK